MEKTLDVESFPDYQEREQYENRISDATSDMLDRNPDMWYEVRQFEQKRIMGQNWEPKWLK